MIRFLFLFVISLMTLHGLQVIAQAPPPPTSNPEVLNTPPPPPGNPEVLATPPPPPSSPERANTNGSSVTVPGVEVPAISTDEPKTPEEFLLEQGDFAKALETGKDVFVTEYKLRSENQNRDPFNSVNAQRKVASEVTTNILEFLEPKMPLENFPINQLKLTGVLWRTASPKASFLDPNGSAHIARKNERIGVNKGYIAAIREGEVIVIEPSIGGETSYQTRVIRISGDDDQGSNQGGNQ